MTTLLDSRVAPIDAPENIRPASDCAERIKRRKLNSDILDQTIEILKVFTNHRRIPDDEKQEHALCEFSAKIIQTVGAMVAQGEKIRLVLPAFPEKAPVREKTLSDLPDMAERVSLSYLSKICQEIQAVYPQGAEFVVYTDGFAFADVFPDIHTQEKRSHYLAKLADLIQENHFENIKIVNLAGQVDLNYFAEEDALFHQRITHPQNDADINSLNLYRGLIRFFISELSMAYPEKSGSRVKKEAAVIARGVARMSDALSKYLSLIEPDALRVSCHPKTVASGKVGIWFNEDHTLGGTPWHNAAVFDIREADHKCAVSFMKTSDAIKEGMILQKDNEGNPSHFVSENVFRHACKIQSFFKAVHARKHPDGSRNGSTMKISP